jgi:hypothetical protein
MKNTRRTSTFRAKALRLVLLMFAGLKIYFTGPSDKMSGDVEFGSDICPMTFSSVLTRK